MTEKFDYKLDRDEAALAAHVSKMVQADIRDALIVSGCETPTTGELLAGRPFRSGNLFVDAAFWAVSLQANDAYEAAKLPRSVTQALRELAAKPDRIKLIRLRRAAKRHRKEWSRSYIRRLQDIEDRCNVTLAALKDTAAQAEQTALAFRSFDVHNASPNNLDVLIRAIVASTGHDYERIVDDVLPKLWVHAKAQRMALRGIDLHAWHGGYKLATAAAPDDYRPPVDLGDLDDSAQGIPAPEKPPSRIVVPAMAKKPRTDHAAHAFWDIAGKPLPLVQFEGDLAEVSRDLCERWPWASSAIKTILMDLVGSQWIRLRPTLLLGPPGTGKTSLALAIARALGLVPTLYNAAGTSDGMYSGTNAGWASARASVSLQALLRAMAANTVIVIDEIEKSGQGRHNGNLQDALVTMVEPTTSRCMLDPALELPTDLSELSYLATANGLDGISGPLLDRFRIIRVPEPGPEHLPVVARQIVGDLRRERNASEAWMPDLDGEELSMLADHWKGGSMRAVRRMIETIVAGREAFAARH